MLLAFASATLVLLPGLRHPWRLLFPRDFKLPPPDLARCARIELQWIWAPKQSPASAEKDNLLNSDEERYLDSLNSIVLVDPNDIKVLADEVVSAQYLGIVPKPTQMVEYVLVTGYIDAEPQVSFVLRGSELETKGRGVSYAFRNNRFPLCLEKFRPQIRPFANRRHCALTLQGLYMRMHHAADAAYPLPSQWCDAIERAMHAGHLPENTIRWAFVCPGVREGESTYAMNPDCKHDSPSDMVLLFETKAGWNQHGGPELFTFDNHDPKGGLVLLNAGRVKFIRTEEELKQLRWK